MNNLQHANLTKQLTKNSMSIGQVEVEELIRRMRGELKVDPMTLAASVCTAMPNDISENELDDLIASTASTFAFQEPEYSYLAARFVSRVIVRNVASTGVRGFVSSMQLGHSVGLIDDESMGFVRIHQERITEALDPSRDRLFQYVGIRTLVDRYLLKHPKTRELIETPQFFFMRVAVGISDTIEEAIERYNLFSTLRYLPSSPTLFNSATTYPQLSSCFLLDSPEDDLGKIYDTYRDIALLSKFSGGIGLAFSKIRAEGSLIAGTNGLSRGPIPFINTLDASVSAVNQGGRRKGACCVYLETWHADVESFLELRDNTGDESRRTHNLNIANWVPDLFMKRVGEDGMWSLFDPKLVPELTETYGDEFEVVYRKAEQAGKFSKQVKARDLYARMMRTLAQTGNGWMCFKDSSNRKSNQTAKSENVIHLSNLCTEILEVTSSDETAVCNLGSINLSKHVKDGAFDFKMLEMTARTALKQLDAVIDRNFYPLDKAKSSNSKWRPVGLGYMGLQDVLLMLGHAFDSEEAKEVSTKIAACIYYSAMDESCKLAQRFGAHPAFKDTRAATGELEPDRWGVECVGDHDWNGLRERVKTYGLRNSLMIAIAPTATIATIAGCYECIEPLVSNLFKKETLSGEFLQVNRYLVDELKVRGLWTEEIREQIKQGQGSIQHIDEIPAEVKHLYRTAWELPMKNLLDVAAARGAYIDQSQSVNLFQESPNIGKLSSMYYYAWQSGLKTTYYLRSRPATRIAQTTTKMTAADAVACSLENPQYCEACQ